MKNLFQVTFLMQFLWTACTTDASKKIEETSSIIGKTITIQKTKIYYEEYGQGMPLILLSGGGIIRSTRDFDKCIPELSKHFRVIASDTPGQGRSSEVDSTSYQLLTEYASQLIDSLKIDSAYVMGWSDGGIVGILLAEKRPDKVKKVLAVGANNGLRAALPPGLDISMVRPDPMDVWERNNKVVIENYMKTLPRDWKKLVSDQNKMWYAEAYFPKSIYDRITIPVMIAIGDKDDIRTEHALEMHRMIKNSQFCVLPNTSHEVFTERPELINKIAIDFFKKR
jgi:pimeloyl-ACP methyl ester carboxylesterase